MNWEAVAAIGEGVGALGVIVSLAFLALQIRMNTKALRGTASFEAENAFVQINHDLIHDREVTAVLIRAYDPSASLADFSDADRVLVALHARESIQRTVGVYRLHANGILDHGLWENRAGWMSGWLKLPVFAEWWETEKTQEEYPSDFVRELEEHPSPPKIIRTGMNR